MSAVRNDQVQWGQHAPASQLIAHLSDTHFVGGGRALYGTVDTDGPVRRAMAQLERSGLRPDALVITGDIADTGEADAYRRVRDIIEASAGRLGARLVWVMGNHDRRAAFRAELLRADSSTGTTRGDSADPVDLVHDLDGLRLIALDTSVPGYHHGELTASQLTWLAEILREPAPRGTVLALHHPPIPTLIPLMGILELRDQAGLAEVIAGSDVRAILGGHLHHATTGLCAGIPVSVAAATCYTIDATAPQGELVGLGGGQSINLVHVYDDQIVHSTVPLGDFDRVAGFDAEFLDRMSALTPAERTEAFSRQVDPVSDGAD